MKRGRTVRGAGEPSSVRPAGGAVPAIELHNCVGGAAVARRSHKPKVAGSIPAPATTFPSVPEQQLVGRGEQRRPPHGLPAPSFQSARSFDLQSAETAAGHLAPNLATPSGRRSMRRHHERRTAPEGLRVCQATAGSDLRSIRAGGRRYPRRAPFVRWAQVDGQRYHAGADHSRCLIGSGASQCIDTRRLKHPKSTLSHQQSTRVSSCVQ